VQVGLRTPWSRFTRVFVSYGAEAVKYSGDGLLGNFADDCRNCVRSSLGLTATHDTRIDMPFPSQGALQTFSAQFNGGPLGGTADFQRYTGELRAFAPLLQIGGERPGSQPIKIVLGLTARGGAVFGGTGPFFYTQQFALGGTQFGEQLRGYEEFSISPDGFIPGTGATQARRESFGNAFFTSTAELGLRVNSQIYLSAFYDAGNVWHQPRDINPTRLFRGAGIGASVITPFGPLGLDWAYGFDRLDQFGRPDPQWQFHFRLGQLF
jgi:outer membrane protein insertion porin family